ncbi:TonB-dependent receptor [Phenylobacterium aquaticum]|uniref:TonB-dependent receptor n=1 Tax=Phenylobacterium aquaticum TaxID=1763816 RepID=UPI001F5D74F7|nr:TonB-dependent receptor [Phenylobacterium aquaticum]MCI3134794.1 TonB-dependent receptor [Phenylobacterium aquaticum]
MRKAAFNRLFATTCGLAFGVALGGQALAADAAGGVQIEEVVVTAQKREQKLQDVPVAVSAFNDKALQAQAVQGLTDLSAKSPNVVLAPVGAYPYASAFYIRGLGFADVESTFEPAVGVEMNGVYLARNSGALQDFFDIDSVEILRGPQGTLYGRNTIGGVVSVRTKRPNPGDPFSGEVQATVGDHGRAEGRLALNVPLNDTFAARGSLLYKTYDGYVHNATLNKTVGDNETLSGRLTLVAKPNDVFDAALVLDGDRERGSGAAFRNAALPGNVYYNFSPDTGTATPVIPAGTSNPKDPYTVYDNTPIFANVDTWGAALTANWKLDLGTVTSVTGYRSFKDKVQSDYDGSAVNFFYAYRDQSHEQFSQEIRLASSTGGAFDYVVGAYYLNQHYAITNTQGGLIYKGATASQIAGQRNIAWALFGQGDYHVNDRLTLTAGGRYSYEEKRFTNQPLFFTASKSYDDHWDNFSPKLSANYKFTPDVMAYATWSKGFRSGGYNGRAASYTSAGPYASETVESYEVGVKSELFERRLRLNGAAFSSKYTDMQVGSQGLTSAGIYESIVTNAGEARIDGVEGEALWLVGGGWRINANLAWLDARFEKNFTDFTSDGINNPTDNSDLPLAYAPKWSGSFGVTYDRDLSFGHLSANANAVYMDDIYTSGGVLNRTSTVQMRPANTLYDAAITLEGTQGWRVSLWGKNLADKAVINNTFGLGALGNLRIYQPPRTWGLEVGYKF